MQLHRETISITENGEQISGFSLSNNNGVEVKIINYGGIITHIFTPDRNGNQADILLGLENPEEYCTRQYQKISPYFGAITGRYCNRIGEGRFRIGADEYQLAKNNGKHHLHGGFQGFDKVMWNAETLAGKDSVSVFLNHSSPDGDQGYPGNLKVRVIYTLNRENELSIEYECVTDKSTPVNLTSHTYFNLSGDFKKDISDHEIMIEADHYTETDKNLIPTGRMLPVEGTLFDLRSRSDLKRITEGVFDLNYVLNPTNGRIKQVVSLYDKDSGRKLEIATDQPGLQAFALRLDNFPLRIKGNPGLSQVSGLALEPQHFPDSPNHQHFPDTILIPGKIYRHKSVYKFSVTD